MSKETIIISLGGSVVAPKDIDVGFLKEFKKCLEAYFNAKKFVVFVGGGKIARIYQKALKEFGAKDTEMDWIGINASRMNAEVIKNVFGNRSYSKVITDPSKKINANKDILVAAGWKPGWSTDYCSVMMAKTLGAKTVINLTNIDYVYDKDPNKFKDAKKIENISWPDFQKIVGDKWSPGLSTPFDPRASKLAKKLKLKVIVINAWHLERLKDFLSNKKFIGTIIE